ncbi:rhomboid family intramembrane serine protease [Neptuniibacter sp. QD48_55]|uniref:rhomboid family intramembrane serine protease n=1 Tax=Neptuniibacter sp. QD48_55 TaxID=3398212 RepID=UPI0039F5D9FB
MIKVLSVPLGEDLTEFTQILWRYEVPHRVVELEHTQEVWIAVGVEPAQIVALYEKCRRGESLEGFVLAIPRAVGQTDLLSQVKQAWMSCLLIASSLLLTFLISFGDNLEWLRLFTIADIVQKDGSLYSSGLEGTLESFEVWRFITPIFLHFSELHIAFNALWIWIVGSRIEIYQGRVTLCLLILFSGVISNIAQYHDAGPMFGGLSGVVFAFLGYAWLWDKTQSDHRIGLPQSIMGFLIFWLVLGYAGVLEALQLGAIANTAHLVGLLAGLAFIPFGKLLATRR